MRPEDADVLEQIRAAFPAVPISAQGAFDPWGNGYLDAREYREQLQGRTWEQLDREYIVRRSDSLGFLGTLHLAALLPVYLTAMVRDGVWSPASEALTIILAKPSPDKDEGLGIERFRALVETLTPVQRSAVAAALRSLAEQDERGDLGMAARAAFEGYWASYTRPAAASDG